MLDTPTLAVPPLSLNDEARDPDAFAADLGGSFERFGFAIVSDHGIDPVLIDRAWSLTKAYFDQPEELKRSYHIPGGGGARGHTPFGTEIAKDAKQHDLKEFWHIGRELAPGHPFHDHMADNVWPAQPDGFKDTMLALYDALDGVGRRLLAAIARHLGLAPNWFDDAIRDGNSVLRLLHYPPIGADAPGVRAGAHEDINLITLLLGAEEAGLELLDKDGRWLPVKPPEGALVVNVGDMLQRLTNHVLPSTTHRVVNPPVERRGLPRYSMPFFLHLRSDFLIETLPETVSADNPDRYPEPITANDYLMQRLREIGLVK
jgi:isopenicillin N synthase-like dioxygenase